MKSYQKVQEKILLKEKKKNAEKRQHSAKIWNPALVQQEGANTEVMAQSLSWESTVREGREKMAQWEPKRNHSGQGKGRNRTKQSTRNKSTSGWLQRHQKGSSLLQQMGWNCSLWAEPHGGMAPGEMSHREWQMGEWHTDNATWNPMSTWPSRGCRPLMPSALSWPALCNSSSFCSRTAGERDTDEHNKDPSSLFRLVSRRHLMIFYSVTL